MQIKVKYLVKRRNKDGSYRYYWDRPGYELLKLGNDLVAAAHAANNANDEAEGRKTDHIASQIGTVNWVIDEYKTTDRYLIMSAGSKAMYETWIKRIGHVMGDISLDAIQRSDVRAFMKSIKTKSGRGLATTVLSNIFETAKDLDLVTVNHALKLGNKKAEGRTEWFTPEDVGAWMEAARGHPHGQVMRVKFWLAYYTGQRVVDCLDMPGGHFDGDSVMLRQEKTHRLMRVPAHRTLRAHLATLRLVDDEPIGGTLSYYQFNRAWNDIGAASGLENKQARDLRRTAVIMLAEAGATDIQIASITGHSLASVKQILDSNYLVRTDPMARAAIDKWEARDDELREKVERGVRISRPK